MPKILNQEILNEPFFSIVLGGKQLDETYTKYVVEIQVDEEVGKLSIGRITISDIDRVWTKDDRTVKGSTVEIRMGHLKKNRVMIKGKIKNIDANFPKEGIPSLTITCVDNGSRLVGKAKSRSWKKRRLSDVIIEIFKANGMGIEAENTKTVLDYIAQSNETDNDFIHRKADEMNFYFYNTSSGVYYFGSTDKYGDPKSTLDYLKGNGQIISFQPSFQEAVESGDSTDSDIDSKTGEVTKDADIVKGSSGAGDDGGSISVDKLTGKVSGR